MDRLIYVVVCLILASPTAILFFYFWPQWRHDMAGWQFLVLFFSLQWSSSLLWAGIRAIFGGTE